MLMRRGYEPVIKAARDDDLETAFDYGLQYELLKNEVLRKIHA